MQYSLDFSNISDGHFCGMYKSSVWRQLKIDQASNSIVGRRRSSGADISDHCSPRDKGRDVSEIAGRHLVSGSPPAIWVSRSGDKRGTDYLGGIFTSTTAAPLRRDLIQDRVRTIPHRMVPPCWILSVACCFAILRS